MKIVEQSDTASENEGGPFLLLVTVPPFFFLLDFSILYIVLPGLARLLPLSSCRGVVDLALYLLRRILIRHWEAELRVK